MVGDVDRLPFFIENLRVYDPRESFHAKNKEIGGKGVPCLMFSTGLNSLNLELLMRMEMEVVETQDITSLIRGWGKAKY